MEIIQGSSSITGDLARKRLPPNRFLLNETDEFRLELEHSKMRTWSGAQLDSVQSQQLQDNLKWHTSGTVMDKFEKHLEFYSFSANANTIKHKPSKRLLIAQYSNHDEFAQIYELTKPVNKAYAERWGHDIVFFNAQEKTTKTANMATLLQLAWEKREDYDQALLLDADAVINLFDYDVTTLFPDSEMVLTQRIIGGDMEHTWRVYGTVSLWNLNHLLVPRVEKTWSTRFKEEETPGSASTSLAEQLKPYAETEAFSVTSEIGHFDSAVIRTLQFATKDHGYRKVDPAIRIDKWQKQVHAICKRYHLKCKSKSTSPTKRSLRHL